VLIGEDVLMIDHVRADTLLLFGGQMIWDAFRECEAIISHGFNAQQTLGSSSAIISRFVDILTQIPSMVCEPNTFETLVFVDARAKSSFPVWCCGN
jgi:hypothetical protein